MLLFKYQNYNKVEILGTIRNCTLELREPLCLYYIYFEVIHLCEAFYVCLKKFDIILKRAAGPLVFELPQILHLATIFVIKSGY